MVTSFDCHLDRVGIWLPAVGADSKCLLELLASPQAKGYRLLYLPPTEIHAF